jgi:O-antigen ligase
LASLKKFIYELLNETKCILKEYIRDTQTVLKKRLQKLLITSIIILILLALGISLIGTASIFWIVGSLKYLSTFMPVWQAWLIMGLISAVIAAILFLVLFLIIRKQLKSR